VITNYDPEYVYNMDDIGLDNCLLLRQNYVHKTETNARGNKIIPQKNRINSTFE